MTLSRLASAAFSAMLIAAVPGCLDITVDTTIHPDGSSERRITIAQPTKSIPDHMFPPVSGAGWSGEWRADPDKKDAFLYTAAKRFGSPEELMAEYGGAQDTGAMSARITLAKRFEWFFSYVDYREVYEKKHHPYRVPIERYLTAEEIKRYLRGEQSDSLDAKMKEWEDREGFEAVYAARVQEAERLRDPSLPVELLERHKEEFFRAMRETDSANAKQKVEGKAGEKKDEIGEILRQAAAIAGTDAVLRLRPSVESALTQLMQEDERYKSPDSWVCTVRMPGMLLETDGTGVEGNSVTWKFRAGQLRCGAYEMHAVSRILNLWAFIVTGAGIVLVLVLTFVRSRRRTSGA